MRDKAQVIEIVKGEVAVGRGSGKTLWKKSVAELGLEGERGFALTGARRTFWVGRSPVEAMGRAQ